MQTFPNTKICNALHENNFAQKIKNSLPCAAARLGTQSFKNQATKKRRAHTIVCMPNVFSARYSKTNATATWKKELSRVFIGARLIAQPFKSRMSHNPKRTSPQHS